MGMTEQPMPARVASPGKIIQRELEARGWSQKDLAEIMQRPPQAINEIIGGTKQITVDTAIELSEAFGMSVEFWTNLETNYRLFLASKDRATDDITRRSRLYSALPIGEMVKRGWIKASDSASVLEREVLDFLRVSSLDQVPEAAVNFRCSIARGPEVAAQLAWVKRVEQIAETQDVRDFDRSGVAEGLETILGYAAREQDIARVPDVLSELGIRFAVVKHLPKTYIDGAALTVREQPVIALSLRYDRIDSFWYTLLHELAHIALGHEGAYLDDLDNPGKDASEQEANERAQTWLLDPVALKEFAERNKPRFSGTKVARFAASRRRHPGIVVGQLHHEGHLEFKNLRSHLVKVSPYLESWTDRPVA